jgi:hypothetical protein
LSASLLSKLDEEANGGAKGCFMSARIFRFVAIAFKSQLSQAQIGGLRGYDCIARGPAVFRLCFTTL